MNLPAVLSGLQCSHFLDISMKMRSMSAVLNPVFVSLHRLEGNIEWSTEIDV
jgi:hypothetical protein